MKIALTHIALHVEDLAVCSEFYQTFCGLKLTKDRGSVHWLAEPGFENDVMIVLVDGGERTTQDFYSNFQHLGFQVDSYDELLEKCQEGKDRGCYLYGPLDKKDPVGHIVLFEDPNGFMVEFNFGQPLRTLANKIDYKIRSKLTLENLVVTNESYMHSVPKGSESHFKIVAISHEFDGMNRIARHRFINEILVEELKIIHALSIQAFTEVEWKERGEIANDSPLCQGK